MYADMEKREFAKLKDGESSFSISNRKLQKLIRRMKKSEIGNNSFYKIGEMKVIATFMPGSKLIDKERAVIVIC